MSVPSSAADNFDRVVTAINGPVSSFAWGWPTVGLISITGVLLMVGLRFMPILRLPYGVRMMLAPSDQQAEGDISSFQALMTSLAATVGTGNIAGVAGAIAIGGPGAVFWMWLIAFFGIATKYAEAVLAVHYREVDDLGHHVGGPMYYISKGLGPRWVWLGGVFALFGMLAGFGIGNGVQCFEVSSALLGLGVPREVTAVVLGVLVFAVIIGGVRRISKAASAIVPFMAIAYVLACLIILLANIGSVGDAFASIFSNAFTGQAAATGTLTALVILVSGIAGGGLSGSELSIAAFNEALAGSGWIVTFGLLVFAFTTVLGWSFYGERCTEYLFGVKAILPFRGVWVAVVVIGSLVGDRGVVWGVADTLNGLMAIPNLIALLLLSGTVVELTRRYRFPDASESSN
ncbi:amino acid carrier family protein [Synechococcus sp. MIT S9220]|uniref:alanine/glycine:cation symporter family protein n=1 Tax=Synechococcus sp. MIT S9220 TaxID=166309 RepID=UPI00164A8F95|nr:alanine:cation symporter family protein [Synechococcus sp. MIT S9220]QNJ22510.1 amino acid carrier family protein [Synechococcus sp. MIT S9220]